MITTIWKFPLTVTDEQIINVPKGAEFLSIQTQHGLPCIWAKVNPKEDVIVCVRVVTIGTGHPANKSNNMKFIGTYQLHNGDFVGHVFVGKAQ